MKIDPYNHEQKYRTWQEAVKEGIPGISKENSTLILRYLHDMEHGLNVSLKSVKGRRSFIRLNTLREKLTSLAKKCHKEYGLLTITDITEEQTIQFFSKMRQGEIARNDGKTYRSVDFYVRTFKAFWHWWQTVNRKQGITIQDLTVDLDARGEKPQWVYLTEEQMKRLCEQAKPHYKVLFLFLFDSGIRSPTELINIRVSDLYHDCKELMIRQDISKTFGRRIKLLLSAQTLKDYIHEAKLTSTDYLFPIKPNTVNKYLKRLAHKLFGDVESPAGEKYSEMTLYDFRHCSCCYWLPRYKSESALKYRFGWKKSDKIHYYSELLGMKDTIAEEDLLIDATKTEIEKRLVHTERENHILRERLAINELKVDALIKKMKMIVSESN